MRILLWHVHGAWTTSFVHGGHEYVVPVTPDRGPDGVGIARTYSWPDTVTEVPLDQIADEDFDVIVYQRPHELELRPPRGEQLIYVEHNAPQGRINELRHPMADRDDLLLVHVTHFNELFWDAGGTETRVIEHGILDPGPLYTGELARAAVVINEAQRRARVTGTDLLPRFEPYDLFGIGAIDLPHAELHREMARRRVYVHPIRWTSLGLSLLEAMHLAMPVVVLGTTEAFEAVPQAAGAVSTRVDVLEATLQRLLADPDEARERGLIARDAALARYGLQRFLADWDEVLTAVEVAP
ncbi:glycosyltransferase [Solirubrobacter sp. CPCC 204708]|uniref:Glycosyltransferase n=1 Tax=Solirubrobacter deserti TaxID=2282478 RepID=A0ABT4RR04_9ACTN|nr:glycosyltransferase [Solirubrobacter deserti]MBE2320051.1 glycosyltransferase [Solirubrobacter deserti]MDA0141009.1 glycosyltransferase [Solirubrobacter deserti]